MIKQIEVHNLLLSCEHISNAYFSPPETIKLKYPCVIYNEEAPLMNRANDTPYTIFEKYNITYISQDPLTNIRDELFSVFVNIEETNHMFVDGLYHSYFTIYI